MKKSEVVRRLISQLESQQPSHDEATAFAPTNIALCKYWGKRNSELNLPMTSSLSIALPSKGAHTQLKFSASDQDHIQLNGVTLSPESEFVKRLTHFLDLFRQNQAWRLQVDIAMNIPVAAGLASSACGFASLVMAMNALFGWGLSPRELSILARLGSGSASRSLWPGFVEWHAGQRDDGMDSYAEPMPTHWEDLRVGIISLADTQKPISSRAAMQRTIETSALYAAWPQKVADDLVLLKRALETRDFSLLGSTAESNALTMHATMLSSWPPVCYHLPETIAAMHQVWECRKTGTEVYFTQDAGPNLKCLFLKSDTMKIQTAFPELSVITPFE